MKNILVTGGCGYIGSHTIVELLNGGYSVIVLDNLSNSTCESLNRVKEITGKDSTFYEGDIRDENILNKIFNEHNIYAVIHFAGLKAVGESVAKPLEYYDNNVNGTLVLLDCMKKHNVKRIIFSSSATVYGNPEKLPLTEDSTVGGTTNPYGTSKYVIERILKDLYKSDNSWSITILRYFNPVGAHKSGLIGEDPNGIPNNLMPYVAQVAVGKLDHVRVFGNDYDTKDGTGVRDYIHVVDLARGHIDALNNMRENNVNIYNLGTGNGYSVLEMIKAMEKACGHKIPYEIVERRSGDIASCYASNELSKKEIGFNPLYDIDDMCKDQWNWQSKNPNGYRK